MKTWRGHYSALLLQDWTAVPVMHLFDGVYGYGDDSADYTKCGRRASRFHVWLLIKHLSKFARPCKICDRIGARQEAA